MLEIDHLARQFNGRSVLRDISLQLQAGEYVAIVGESGVGKLMMSRSVIRTSLMTGCCIPNWMHTGCRLMA